MAGDADIISKLPALRWRGLVSPPYELVTFEFKNMLVERPIAYLDGEPHDNTGRKSFPMTARLFFLNTVGGGETAGRRHFPELWEDWKEHLDGEIGEFVHPVLGPLHARVDGCKGEVRASVRAGIIVDITWVETIRDPSIGNFLAVLQADPSTIATAVDVAWEELDLEYPNNLGASTLAGAWDAIRPSIFTADVSLLDDLANLLGAVLAMIAMVEDLYNDAAEFWGLLENLLAFWSAAKDQADAIARLVRPTAKRVVRRDMTLDEFATSVGNSLADVMGLNIFALRSPIVGRGTTLTYFA